MDGAKLPPDLWAKARVSDLGIFVQEVHHERRLGGEYEPLTVEEWDGHFAAWLFTKGRVRGPLPVQSTKIDLGAMEDVPYRPGPDSIIHELGEIDGVVAQIGEPIDLDGEKGIETGLVIAPKEPSPGMVKFLDKLEAARAPKRAKTLAPKKAKATR